MKQGKKFLKFKLNNGQKVKAIKIGKTDTAIKYMLYDCLGPEMFMNENGTTEGGFEESDMRKYLNEELIRWFKDSMKEKMEKDENGDYLTLPTVKEICSLKDWRDRIALDEDGESTWYWLRDVATSTNFARVAGSGYCNTYNASYSYGVRPAFYLHVSADNL